MINLLHGNDEFSSNQFLKGIVEQKNISEFDLNVVDTNDLTENKIDPPAIVVVGDVVYLRDGLDWVGALSGRILSVDPLKTRISRDVG